MGKRLGKFNNLLTVRFSKQQRAWTFMTFALLCVALISMSILIAADAANESEQLTQTELYHQEAPDQASANQYDIALQSCGHKLVIGERGCLEKGEWIIAFHKNGNLPDEFYESSDVISHDEENGIVLARPHICEQEEGWLERWRNDPRVDYLQFNHEVTSLSIPNDPRLADQRYLDLIRAKQAWETVHSNPDLVIAVVDTGIDLQHQDLKDQLVPGANMINSSRSVHDDHGHGTNIAGVIAAIGNNNIGISGILWSAKLMPVKAISANGRGSEYDLGQGIQYAVDNGANIIVLASGLYYQTAYMAGKIKQAELNNVLVIAAAGNDGGQIKFPAAYPTVLAVGGVQNDLRVNPDSNRGSELDIVAPWNVYTTALKNRYAANMGTSMAVPQVAAAAGLVWALHPEMRVDQLRQHLRYTAQPLTSARWTRETGYGLLRVDRAVTMAPVADMYTPNQARAMAAILPLDTMISATINQNGDPDWYRFNAEYKGSVTFRIQVNSGQRQFELQLDRPDGSVETKTFESNTNMTLPVQKGTQRLRIRLVTSGSVAQIPYRLTTTFNMYRDNFEPNDRQFTAFTLPARTQTITGTFHKTADHDWYAIHVNQAGTMQITVSTDTTRIDSEITVQKEGEASWRHDRTGEGETEVTRRFDVFPGKYYIRIRNATDYPVIGEYQMKLDYTIRYEDLNEPNNIPATATRMINNNVYPGTISPASDVDWFTFVLYRESQVKLALSNIPENRLISMSIQNGTLEQLHIDVNQYGTISLQWLQTLQPGTYYVKLTANDAFVHQQYALQLSINPLIAGFTDIFGHWAMDDLVDMHELGLLGGFGDGTLRPDESLTRAQATSIISRALRPQQAAAMPFSDVPASHWAYENIRLMAGAGWIEGYPDGTFRPNQALTRMEMTALLAKSLGLAPSPWASNVFSDLPDGYWGIPLLGAMVEAGWITGYGDGTFRPNQEATRAEISRVLMRILRSL